MNTGWVGGPFGVGERISIKHTRALLNAALTGQLENVQYDQDPVFGFEVPRTCPGVPDDVLEPWSSWPNREEYDKRYKQLAQKFIENFKKFETHTTDEIRDAGPRI